MDAAGLAGCPEGRSPMALGPLFHQSGQASPDSFDFLERVGHNLAQVPFLPLSSRAHHAPDSFDSLAFKEENRLFFLWKANESNESGGGCACDSPSNTGQDGILTPSPAPNANESNESGGGGACDSLSNNCQDAMLTPRS